MPEVPRAKKSAILADLRRDYAQLNAGWKSGEGEYEAWFNHPLNNARLNTIATYHDLLPGFERLLVAQDGNLEKFYREVKRVGRLSTELRRERLTPATTR